MNIDFLDRRILLEFDTIDIDRYGNFEKQRKFERELIEKINLCSKKIHEANIKGSANYVIFGGTDSWDMFHQAMVDVNQANVDNGEFLE